jgi:hypothetical protein
LQHFVTSKLFKVIFIDFFLENKNWEIQFLRVEPYFLKKKYIRSPGREPAMVLRYVCRRYPRVCQRDQIH